MKRKCGQGHFYEGSWCPECSVTTEIEEVLLDEDEVLEDDETIPEDADEGLEPPPPLETKEKPRTCETCGVVFYIPVQRGRPPKWCNSCRDAGAAVPLPRKAPDAPEVPGWDVLRNEPWVEELRAAIRGE